MVLILFLYQKGAHPIGEAPFGDFYGLVTAKVT